MPKEYINPRHAGTSADPTPVGVVQWARDCYVTIGVQAGGDYNESEIERPQMHLDLSRDGVNRLIRTLRKARDQAFGADA